MQLLSPLHICPHPADSGGIYCRFACQWAFTNTGLTFNIRLIIYVFVYFQPQPEDNFLVWLNQMCVSVGLFFFGLAILTFLLCSWSPKINNTARLHLCINVALSQLLLLWDDKYVNEPVQYKIFVFVSENTSWPSHMH